MMSNAILHDIHVQSPPSQAIRAVIFRPNQHDNQFSTQLVHETAQEDPERFQRDWEAMGRTFLLHHTNLALAHLPFSINVPLPFSTIGGRSEANPTQAIPALSFAKLIIKTCKCIVCMVGL